MWVLIGKISKYEYFLYIYIYIYSLSFVQQVEGFWSHMWLNYILQGQSNLERSDYVKYEVVLACPLNVLFSPSITIFSLIPMAYTVHHVMRPRDCNSVTTSQCGTSHYTSHLCHGFHQASAQTPKGSMFVLHAHVLKLTKLNYMIHFLHFIAKSWL